MSIPWGALADQYGHDVVGEIRHMLFERTGLELDPSRIAAKLRVANENVLSVLDRLAEEGAVERITTYRCECGQDLSAEELSVGDCPNCQRPFAEMDERPASVIRYLMPGDPRRTISWLVAVHGMNTTGRWQEEFNWRVATKYKFSAPVAIYKYGIVRPGVLVQWRQRQLMRQLGDRILELVKHAKEQGFSARPDILAHSFGTWLIGHLLTCNDRRYGGLAFSRVILTGCILRPDFDWDVQIKAGRVEAVLNHYGTRDRPVRISHYLIPDSGPAGRTGFIRPGAYNASQEEWGHSSFFAPEHIRKLLDGGLWEEFLTRPASKLPDAMPDDCQDPDWKASRLFVRVVLRYVVLLAFVVVVLGIAALVVLGVWTLLLSNSR